MSITLQGVLAVFFFFAGMQSISAQERVRVGWAR